jgi:hypothetical protein
MQQTQEWWIEIAATNPELPFKGVRVELLPSGPIALSE